jgi:lysophospholipase L1-like esterase
MNFELCRRWRLTGCLLATLALFLAGVGVGQCQVVKAQLRSLWPGPDGLRLDSSATLAATADLWLDGPADVVIAGDSLIAAGRWDEIFPGISIHNRGIGGDTVSGLLLRSDAIIAKSPRQIIVMIGINDLMAGSSTKDIARRYEALVAKFAPESHIILLSVLQCGPPKCNQTMNKKVASLNIAIADIAQRHKVRFVDLNPSFTRQGQLKRHLTYDGVHLNGLGYRLMRELLMPQMRILDTP